MKKIILIGIGILLIADISNSFAQCSDAGVCQLGFVYEEKTPKKFDAGISYSFGTSGKEEDVKFHSVNLDVSYQPFSSTKFTVVVPYNAQSDALVDVSGIGDLILSFTQNIFSKKKQTVSLTLGAKLATGDDNKDNLPQIYQSGLGSNDMLIGINYSANNVLLGIGYQVAGSRNDNILKLERGDDFIARGSYSFKFDELNISPQLLLIKRIGESSVLDSTVAEQQFVELEDSDQLQINFLLNANYSISKDLSLVAEVAVPFLKRDVNVDGLTRTFGAGVGLRYKF